MNTKEIMKKAYELMDEPILNENCGLLCNFHCCRDKDSKGNELGMYLIPLEYESIFGDKENIRIKKVKKEEHGDIYLPDSVGDIYYMYCDGAMNCLRELRPIHCRTYPLLPHIENGTLKLVIEKNQIHDCPVLNMEDKWRKEYIKGIFEAWKLLLQIPKVKILVKYDSDNRIRYNNIGKEFNL